MARLNDRVLFHLGSLLLAILVSACGGGGGGGGAAVAVPVVSASSFSMPAVLADQVNNGYTQNFSISGTQVVGGTTFNVTGTGTITVAPASNAVFEGQVALQNSSTTTVTLTVNGITAPPVTETSQSFSTTSYAPLGMSNGEYWVVQGVPVIPATVKVGDTGVIGTYTRYTDNTKTSVLGTAQASYVVEADTATSAVINLILREFDNASVVELTDQIRWRIDTLGNVAWQSETATGPGLNYIFN